MSGVELPNAPKPSQEAAKKLLESAGYKRQSDGTWKKKNTNLTLRLTTVKNDQFEKAAKSIAEQLNDFGIDVTVSVIDDTQANSNFRQDVLLKRNYEMLLYELPIGADPDVYAYWHSSQVGVSGYNFTNFRSMFLSENV
jgi:peptide/nickel transport system substrate-binding protein